MLLLHVHAKVAGATNADAVDAKAAIAAKDDSTILRDMLQYWSNGFA